jgi:hypothetical protein
MEIYTIGFTQTTAEHFFGRLKAAGVGRLLDVRLNNSSQLAGFAKAQDLPYFLERLVGARYEHDPRLAPTQELKVGSDRPSACQLAAWPRANRMRSSYSPVSMALISAAM